MKFKVPFGLHKRKKIALSIRGCGARFGGYFGALKAFEDNNIHFDMWTGASGGSVIIAGLATGASITELFEFSKGMRIKNFVDIKSLEEHSLIDHKDSLRG